MRVFLSTCIIILLAGYANAQSFSIIGNVKDQDYCLHKPLKGAMVVLSTKDKKHFYTTKTDSLGNYCFDSSKVNGNTAYIVFVDYYVDPNESYCIYNRSFDTISTVGITHPYIFTVNFELTNNVDRFGGPEFLFDYKNSSINKIGNDITFCELIKLLNDNPKIVIELDGHCSPDEGGNRTTMALSLVRAKACRDYIVMQGIDSTRVKAKGFGISQVLYSSGDIAKMKTNHEKEQACLANRSVRLRVLDFNYKPKGGYSHQDSLRMKALYSLKMKTLNDTKISGQ